ncbi:DUF4350 domain-containing protein [Algibacillus agarilyticus]|uniref:DUF4350 domain-containing protein n=1 Tax=Algibacillus agarilyticus TaxID=2234133 RepID=UPI000DCFC72A|nr:DUF4350 domain-containing protein [Algibacillus agarilyticus]
MNNKKLASVLLAAMVTVPACATTTSIVGTGDYVVKVENPTYKKGTGPRISIDEGHNNYQTMEHRFKGFADLVQGDGYQAKPLKATFTASSLANTDILVICNALNAKNAPSNKDWVLPAPSAFTTEEITAVKEWVNAGGSLLLISDHMPFPSAAAKLGEAFNVEIQSNFAFNPYFTFRPGDMNLMRFYQYPGDKQGGTLLNTPIVKGNNPSEAVPYVITFTGSAFRMKPGVPFTPVMQLGKGTTILWPTDYAVMGPTTPSAGGDGLYQGVIMSSGKGRVAVFGEASMFSVGYADWENNYPMGFNNPEANHNQQFVLNLMHWLSNK